eukprot:TRINITY_DN4747_c0_g1_i1.p2 TRINITY_DN4747_c0_g1~~TRINITY_DN4747_c0_g1_i1.p2  ORF type:complete len:171 (-),score=1.38 TRINITY_DN4747_c0_g1_i1:721-1233(-)
MRIWFIIFTCYLIVLSDRSCLEYVWLNSHQYFTINSHKWSWGLLKLFLGKGNSSVGKTIVEMMTVGQIGQVKIFVFLFYGLLPKVGQPNLVYKFIFTNVCIYMKVSGSVIYGNVEKNMILNEKLCFQEQRDDYDRVKKYRFKRATMFQEQRDDYHRSKGECMSVSWKIFS